jgi:hypothetical protein
MNVDMNYFLLLKNELSLNFLRDHENVLQGLRTAMHLEAVDKNRKDASAAEKFKQFCDYLDSKEV